MDLFEEQFSHKIPDKMLQTLHNLKNRVSSNANEVTLVEYIFE